MEPLTQTSILTIQDASQVAVARRAAAEFAEVAGFDAQRVSALNIVIVELANNLLQHAGGGQLYLRYLVPLKALDVAAVDSGKGMANIDLCLQDGFSTRSTPGLGLGAVRRFATRFAAFSQMNRRTVVAARMSEAPSAPDCSVVCAAVEGESLSGDSWDISEDGRTFLVVDGLGHGLLAAEAARAAVEAFRKHPTATPAAQTEKMHAALRSTRGAAAAIAQIDPSSRRLQFVGIGNITCTLMNSARSQSMVSHNGTLGHQVRRVQQFEYEYQPGDLLVMQSDGLSTHAKSPLPPTLLAQSPMVIAPWIFSEQLRGRDDATILVNRLA